MTTPDEKWWNRARRAQTRLMRQVLNQPKVIGVDIGKDPLGVSSTPVLRVYVEAGDISGLKVPAEVDGVLVRLIPADKPKI